jgi:hypothetical protein
MCGSLLHVSWLRNGSVWFWAANTIFFILIVAGWEWLDSVRPDLWWLPFAILLPIGLAAALLRRRVD